MNEIITELLKKLPFPILLGIGFIITTSTIIINAGTIKGLLINKWFWLVIITATYILGVYYIFKYFSHEKIIEQYVNPTTGILQTMYITEYKQSYKSNNQFFEISQFKI